MILRMSLLASLGATLVLATQAGCSSSGSSDGRVGASAATGLAGSNSSGAPSAGGTASAVAGSSTLGGSSTFGGSSTLGGSSTFGGSSTSSAGQLEAGGNVGAGSGAGGASSGGNPGSSGASSSSGGQSATGGVSSAGMSGANSGGGSGGTATCGCNGKSGCAVWDKVYMTWYGFNDNSCATESQHGCNDIANPGLGPKMHQGATEGVGTYDDPITAAASDSSDSGHSYESSGGATLSPGTLIYNPEVKKYFIMEDSCLECGDEYACKLSSDDTDDPNPPAGCVKDTYLHIDFWMGPSFAQDSNDLESCEDGSTIGDTYKGTGMVVVNPPDNLPVVTTPLYTGTGTGGGCWTKGGVSSVCQ